MAPGADIEDQRAAELNARRNKIQRQSLLQKPAQNPQGEKDVSIEPQENNEHQHKSRLNFLKAKNHLSKQALNKRGGELAGSWAGGTIGSVVPFLGTAAGAFLGRYIGKKIGVTGIIIISLLIFFFTLFMFMLFFLISLKGFCDTWTGWATDKLFLGVCQSIGSLRDVK